MIPSLTQRCYRGGRAEACALLLRRRFGQDERIADIALRLAALNSEACFERIEEAAGLDELERTADEGRRADVRGGTPRLLLRRHFGYDDFGDDDRITGMARTLAPPGTCDFLELLDRAESLDELAAELSAGDR